MKYVSNTSKTNIIYKGVVIAPGVSVLLDNQGTVIDSISDNSSELADAKKELDDSITAAKKELGDKISTINSNVTSAVSRISTLEKTTFTYNSSTKRLDICKKG